MDKELLISDYLALRVQCSLGVSSRVTLQHCTIECEVVTGGVCVCVFQALVGEKACYQSVSSYAGQIVYLGTKVLDAVHCTSSTTVC